MARTFVISNRLRGFLKNATVMQQPRTDIVSASVDIMARNVDNASGLDTGAYEPSGGSRMLVEDLWCRWVGVDFV